METSHEPQDLKLIPPQTFALMRAEDEIRHDLALKTPRKEGHVISACLDELDRFPEFASKSYYSIPYKDGDGGTTFIEGPSIKAAMAMARRWGNCVNGARIFEDTADRIVVEGLFRDYETNTTTVRHISVPKEVWSKKMQRVTRLREDRLNIAIQAGMSKAVRNAILASLPVSFVDSYFKKSKEIAAGSTLTEKKGGNGRQKAPVTLQDRLGKAITAFVSAGASQPEIEAYIANLKAQQASDEEIIQHFIGLWNAVKDGMLPIEEAFKMAETPQKTGEVKSSEVFKNG